jgi:hypothetical protein
MISILEMLVKFSLQFNFLDRRLKNAKSSVEISLVLFFQIFKFLLNIACASNFSAQRQQISQLLLRGNIFKNKEILNGWKEIMFF